MMITLLYAFKHVTLINGSISCNGEFILILLIPRTLNSKCCCSHLAGLLQVWWGRRANGQKHDCN